MIILYCQNIYRINKYYRLKVLGQKIFKVSFKKYYQTNKTNKVFLLSENKVLMSQIHSRYNKNRKEEFSSVKEFEILDEIGKGGYSIVYLVRHKETGKKYALKSAMKYKKEKNRSDRIRQEIDVLNDMDYRRIIQLKGWFEDDENIYLVLQYISGRDLAKFFKQNPPNKNTIADVIYQIVRALRYCHHRGIIHRDMKLENVLIDQKLRIKLTDFGLCAIKSDDDEYFFDEVGTARYTAPELLRKNGYNEGVDVWSIGIMLFMLLTGTYPFDGSRRKNIFKRILNEHIDYDQYDLSTDEIHLLGRLLCKNPKYRIKLEDITKHPWFEKYLDR